MSEDVPLPKVNQRYKDDHGALVTVTSVEETREEAEQTRIPAENHAAL